MGKEWATLPQHFRESGWQTYGAGKLFHPGLPPSFDARKSWDEFVWSQGDGTCTKDPGGCPTTPIGCNGTVNGWPVLEADVHNVDCRVGNVGLGHSGCENETGAIVEWAGLQSANGKRIWCAVNRSRLGGGGRMVDDVTAEAAMDFLTKQAKAAATTSNNETSQSQQQQQQPFFLAVGFHKPHTPYNFPSEFLDLYPPGSVRLPAKPNPPQGMPLAAWHESADSNSSWGLPTPAATAIEYRRAYYAATSYVDWNIGRVLDKLDELGLANDTVVALTSDHGYL